MPPAAMRYTECRLAKPAMALLDDIDEDTVDFQANYDGNEHEPVVLPARFPNLLVNGAGGIAVGMATNIPPHNLGEVIDACMALIDDPALGIDDLIKIVPGPDFPTGGIILGRAGIRSAYHTGRGSIVMRGKVEIETIRKEREAIIISRNSLPGEQGHDGRAHRRAGAREEDRRHRRAARRVRPRRLSRGDRAQARGRCADVVLNQLYRFTPLQTSFGANMVALDGGRPLVMNLKDMLTAFVAFREEVVSRRTKFRLGKARDRAHILVGLAIAVANIDEVIKLIRASKDANEARDKLMEREWPANTAAELIALIDDPRHRDVVGRHRQADRRADQGDPRSAPAAAHRARPRRDQGRARQARRRDRRLSRHPALARAHPGDRQGRAQGRAKTSSPRRAAP